MGQWTELMLEEWLPWILGIGVPVIGGLFTLWLKSEHRKEQRIAELSDSNHEAHTELHRKIAETDEKSQHRHNALRDKIEKIWQHMVRHED